MQVDKEVVVVSCPFLGKAAALQSQATFVNDVKVMSADLLLIKDQLPGSQVADLVDMPGGTDEDVCNFLHVD